jgi:hypothetical protein
MVFLRCSSGANPWQFYYLDRACLLQAQSTVYRGSGALPLVDTGPTVASGFLSPVIIAPGLFAGPDRL